MALLVIDVMHDFACPDGDALYEHAQGIVAPLSKLRARAKRCAVPVVYLNDNFGRWRSSFGDTAARAEESARGDIARRLHPGRSDLAVLKPGRSGSAAITRSRHERALHVMHDAFDVDVRSSEHIAYDLFASPAS